MTVAVKTCADAYDERAVVMQGMQKLADYGSEHMLHTLSWRPVCSLCQKGTVCGSTHHYSVL
jgi:hypothetical protein